VECSEGGEVMQKGVEFNFYRREHFGIIKFCGVIEQLLELDWGLDDKWL
jgi:hypothetical protein